MTVSLQTLPPQIQQRYNAKLLSTPERNLIHNLFASPVELPDNQGFIDRQSRYERLDLFPVPLDDVQNNPPAQQLNRVDVDCRVRTYATYVLLTRQVTITNEDPKPKILQFITVVTRSIHVHGVYKSSLMDLNLLTIAA